MTERWPELKRSLLRGDASLLGAEWDDPRDLALAARVTASSTRTSLGADPAADAGLLSLEEHDLGVHLPVAPRLDAVEVLLHSETATETDIELWTTARGENHIPVRRIATTRVPVSAGRGWVRAQFDHSPAHEEDVVVVVPRQRGLSAVVSDTPSAYGVLGLVSREPRFTAPQNDEHPQTNAWSARELRRKSVALRVEPETEAYVPDRAVGGFSRPFRGPQLWSSAPGAEPRAEHLEVRWDQRQAVGGIELVFNDDVDEDLINLHHHRTPFEAMPELVRDYRVQVETEQGWVDAVDERGNRRRQRRHVLPTAAHTHALRLVVDATNGADSAMVHSVRVFAPEDATTTLS